MSQDTVVYLKDYAPVRFQVESINLDFDILKDKTIVTNTLQLSNPLACRSLRLDGQKLKLMSVKLDGVEVDTAKYVVTDTHLELESELPLHFSLEIITEILPQANTELLGFYQSGKMLCTQNEPEGFRRITYFFDRPDVMSVYKTTLRGDKSQYPCLLANGNLVEKGDLPEGRHFCTWEDPFKKPSYLFAVVAGDLEVKEDFYVTGSGRKITLQIFVDPGNLNKTEHAMNSLKKAMQWDEEVYGLEYDLDIYMIVAVGSFNMGAMENKGLNIFNANYVLASSKTASDADFQNIEGIIGHEYFHNWTGNRVTCRDWFQLTLKEGLTVFRDQEFSGDMLSRSVGRIQDVKKLKEHQFPEDAGPTSHPIKPKSYKEINNFYTATVYEKGAEVIRMLHTLLGAQGFRKGMDLYFKRHDGQAVTTEDFVSAMSDANKVDLSLFLKWYDQKGTPTIEVSTDYNAVSKVLELRLLQKQDVLHIPLKLSLFSASGEEIIGDQLLELKAPQEVFTFENIATEPILSLNRNFSAPIIINQNQSLTDIFFLAKYDSDPFNRYEAIQKLYRYCIQGIRQKNLNTNSGEVKDFFAILSEHLQNEQDLSWLALALTAPTVGELNQDLERYDFEGLHQARHQLLEAFAHESYEQLKSYYLQLHSDLNSDYEISQIGKRSLKAVLLDFMVRTHKVEAQDLALKQFDQAIHMNDQITAFKFLSAHGSESIVSDVQERFFKQWQYDNIVVQKWFSVCAATIKDDFVNQLKKLEANICYSDHVPNIFRSLFFSFARQNLMGFHGKNGESYKYLVDKISVLDEINPHLAAGTLLLFGDLKRYDDQRQQLLREYLKGLSKKVGLSKDSSEILDKILA
jgi:aminopeptidase N